LKGVTTVAAARTLLEDETLITDIVKIYKKKIALNSISKQNLSDETLATLTAEELQFATTGQVEREKLAAIQKCWNNWREIFSSLTTVTTADKEGVDKLDGHLKEMSKYYKIAWGKDGTPYLHIVLSHSIELIKKYGSLGIFEQQGLEGSIKIHKFSAYKATSRRGGKKPTKKPQISGLFCYQILFRFLRIIEYGPKFTNGAYFQDKAKRKQTETIELRPKRQKSIPKTTELGMELNEPETEEEKDETNEGKKEILEDEQIREILEDDEQIREILEEDSEIEDQEHEEEEEDMEEDPDYEQ
jgi:hypothetical protein